jgi:hypothetical protein
MRIYMNLLQNSSPKRSKRSLKIQTVEDLLQLGEATMQQMERGEITAVEAKTTMQGLEHMSQLLQQRVQQHGSQQAPKAPLPEFMRIAIES